MTTVRYYLPDLGLNPGVSPAFGSLWDVTASAGRYLMPTAPSNTTLANRTRSETLAGVADVLCHQWVSAADLPATTIEGTFRAAIRVNEGSTDSDAMLQVAIHVFSGDGTTLRGTLFAGQSLTSTSPTSTDPNYEMPTSAAIRCLSGDLTPVVAQAGDRLVVEIGARFCNATTTSKAVAFRVGDASASSDIPFTVDSTDAGRPWIEFEFEEVVDPPATPTGLVATPATTSIELGWTAGVGGDPADGFEVRIDGGDPVDVGNVLTHEFTGLYPGTTHTMEVRAYNDGGASDWASIEATTLAVDEADFTADITIGDHVFVIQAGDEVTPGLQVLDNLQISWATDESRPWPAQPGTVTCALGLWTNDVTDLSDVVIGTPIAVVLTDLVGEVFATFHGRVARMAAQPRRNNGLGMLYSITGVDYTVDLTELSVTVDDWPAETGAARFARIVSAIEAAGLSLDDTDLDPGDAAFEERAGGATTALELLESHLVQVAVDTDPGLQRYIVAPVVVAGLLDHFAIVRQDSIVDAALLPGVLDVIEGVFQLTFPDTTADGAVDACVIELAATWNRLKYRATNQVTVTGQTVSAYASRPGPPVRLNLQTTLTDQDAADRMAQLYLPDVDETNGWVADTFTVHAHRQPYSITPAWFPDHRDDPATTAVYVMPIAILGIPAAINLAGEDVYAGQLVKVALRIAKRRILVDFGLRRQLPASAGDDAVTWQWVKDNHPTVDWTDVDPALTWYDARLGRTP